MKRRRPLLFLVCAAVASVLRGQNDKLVLGPQLITPYQIAQGAKITYLIRFQNFGGDTARNISIRDTLDPRLDATTFEMIDASHTHTLIRGGEVVRWYFNDIELPDSTENPVFSKGYIMFRVKPKEGLYPGQVIRNQAFIYFDGAQIINTNEVVVRIDEQGPTTGPGLSQVLVFPNPNNGVFETSIHLTDDEPAGVCITDATGKAASFTAVETSAGSRISLEHLDPGIYYLQTKVDGVIRVAPFVVVR